MHRKSRNVVVTGLGVISAAGFNKEDFFETLCTGVNVTGPIESVDTKGFRRTNAGEIKKALPHNEKWNQYGRASKMSLLASLEALQDAGIGNDFSGLRAAVSLGTMSGGSAEIERWFLNENGGELGTAQKELLMQYSQQSTAASIAHEFKIKGPVNSVMTACASGTTALGIGYKWIKYGRADLVLCGGVEAFRIMTHHEVSTFRIVSAGKVTPFDANRKGILIGEGAGMMILESEESAQKRNANIYCKVLGYGASCDAYDLAHPCEDGEGISLAMERAIKDANIDKHKIGYINAHGTGTVKNDSAETAGIKKVFGGHVEKLLVSSIKGSIGHTLGAAGSLEAVATILALHKKKVPPTINFQNPDPLCDLNIVPNTSVSADMEAAMSNSSGFGGNNAAILFGRAENG